MAKKKNKNPYKSKVKSIQKLREKRKTDKLIGSYDNVNAVGGE